MSREKITEMYIKAMEDAEAHPENYSEVFEGYENNPAKALALVDWQKDRIKSLEMTVKILGEMLGAKQSEAKFYLSDNAEYFLNSLGYRKQSELTPCDVCKFNPPTSGDNKPCSICPAQMKGGAE